MRNRFYAPSRAAGASGRPLYPGASRAAALVAACVVVAACRMPTHPDSVAPPTDPFNPAATQLLDDTAWTLATWRSTDGSERAIAQAPGGRADESGNEHGGQSANEAAGRPTLVFSTATGQRRASGFAGCNRFGASYSLESGKLSFGPIVSTRMACPGARGELEHAYLDALAHIAKTGVQWRAPRQLQIITEDGATLRFNAASAH
jgi:heat shock protein HslJ